MLVRCQPFFVASQFVRPWCTTSSASTVRTLRLVGTSQQYARSTSHTSIAPCTTGPAGTYATPVCSAVRPQQRPATCFLSQRGLTCRRQTHCSRRRCGGTAPEAASVPPPCLPTALCVLPIRKSLIGSCCAVVGQKPTVRSSHYLIAPRAAVPWVKCCGRLRCTVHAATAKHQSLRGGDFGGPPLPPPPPPRPSIDPPASHCEPAAPFPVTYPYLFPSVGTANAPCPGWGAGGGAVLLNALVSANATPDTQLRRTGWGSA